MKAFLLLPIIALTLYGADVTGSWTGTVEVADPSGGNNITQSVKAHFEQKGSVVSGAIGRAEDDEPSPIKNAKLEGNNLVFEVQPPEATSPFKFTLKVVSDNMIQGEMKGAVDAGNITGKVTLNRK